MDLIAPENPLDPRMIALYRAATPERKLLTVMQLNAGLIALRDAYLVSIHPEWSQERRKADLRRWWFGAHD
jgi:hypothetical protein